MATCRVQIAGVQFEVMRSDDQAIRTVKIFRPAVLRRSACLPRSGHSAELEGARRRAMIGSSC